METIDHPNSITTAIEAGKSLAGVAPRVTFIAHPENDDVKVPIALVEDDGHPTVILLSQALEALDARMGGPERRKGHHRLSEVDSLIAFVNRYADDSTIVYADTAALGFTVVFDDHPPGAESDAAWREFRASYHCPRSPEWKAWTGLDGKPMRQADFADFIESRLEDLRTVDGLPQPLEVLQVARQLNIKTKGEFRREYNPTNGDSILVNKTETAEGSTVIPRAFAIAVPVFEGGELYQVEVRVRFAIGELGPMFTFVMHRRAEIERSAFNDVRTKVASETKRLILAGTP